MTSTTTLARWTPISCSAGERPVGSGRRSGRVAALFGPGADRRGGRGRARPSAPRETCVVSRGGAPGPGEPFRPTRDLGAKREAYDAGARSGSLNAPRTPLPGGGRPGSIPPRPAHSETQPQARPPIAARPRIPGERQFRDGDRVRHARFGDGIVVTSKLTRSDEEITVAFSHGGGVKTLLASIANLDLIG